MKKLFASLFILIMLAGAGYGGGAYWLGMQTEARFKNMIGALPQSPYFSITIPTYQRGIFKSHAVTAIKFNLPRQNNNNDAAPIPAALRLNLSHNIWHGPLPYEQMPDGTFHLTPMLSFFETTVTIPDNALPNIPELLEIAKLLTFTDYTTINLDGSGTSASTMAAWQKQIGKDDHRVDIDWQGLASHTSFTADLKGIHGATSMPGLAITGGQGMLIFDKLAVTMDTDPGQTGFSVGDAKISLAKLAFADESKGKDTQFEMSGLTATSNTRENGAFLNHSQTARINQVLFNHMKHGPFIYEFELRNLDAATLRKLLEKTEMMQLQVMNNPGQGADPQLLGEIVQLIPGLIKQGLELELKKLSIDTRDGNFSARLKLRITGDTAAAMANPILLLSAVEIEAEASASEYLLTKTIKGVTRSAIRKKNKATGKMINNLELDRQASRECRAQLEALQNRGIIARDQDRFKATATYHDGIIKINEVDFPLQNLLQLATQ
ncbi:MAG: YdgA family protein [Desulfobulbaceae bacterium]|nr:YdgA family protein [Desulfobulbaceae bacterium]HIJ77893.1 YdgA family protein [Deltaproteobacteria bacterium]